MKIKFESSLVIIDASPRARVEIELSSPDPSEVVMNLRSEILKAYGGYPWWVTFAGGVGRRALFLRRARLPAPSSAREARNGQKKLL